jgi:hypothetical protein
MKRLRSFTLTQTGLIVAMVVLAVVGLALLGTYFYLSRQSTADTGWVDPQASVNSTLIAPDLAVLTLAGEGDDRIVRASLDAGERETAYATLAYSALLPDAVRSGQWLVLANAYQENDPARAGVAYQPAMDLLALGPALGDSARAEISLQAARGYSLLDRSWLASTAVTQAESIARDSLTLLPAQRRAILNQVAAAYEQLGQGDAARSIRDNLVAYSAGPGVLVEPASPLLPTLRGSVVLPSDVAAALSARQQAAASLAAQWLSASPDERDALAAALGETLVREDAARTAFYARSGDLALPDRLALLHDKTNWLTVRLRAARGAYGASLVPAWEEQTAAIITELNNAYTEIINGYGQQLDTLGEDDKLRARVELLRQGVLWVRLGLFPDQGAEQALSQQLTEASRDLWMRQGGVGLQIVSQEERGLVLYLLEGSDSNQEAQRPAQAGRTIRRPIVGLA